MNGSDGGNLIHLSHFSSVFPKEEEGKKSLTILYPCFRHLAYIHNGYWKLCRNKRQLTGLCNPCIYIAEKHPRATVHCGSHGFIRRQPVICFSWSDLIQAINLMKPFHILYMKSYLDLYPVQLKKLWTVQNTGC